MNITKKTRGRVSCDDFGLGLGLDDAGLVDITDERQFGIG